MLGKSQTKYIQSLGHKKARDADGVFIAEGPKLIHELLAHPSSGITRIYAVKEWLTANNAYVQGIDVVEVSGDELAKISQLSTPNKVLAIARQRPPVEFFHLKNQVLLALDTIQDPGNMGTITRIADWFGISQVVASRDCADIYNPKVVQSTMGSLLRVDIMYTDLEQWLKQHRGQTQFYAAALDGDDVTAMDRISEGVVIIGNESKGIADEIMKMVDKKITIPRIGGAESLNAAVATGIILSHLR